MLASLGPYKCTVCSVGSLLRVSKRLPTVSTVTREELSDPMTRAFEWTHRHFPNLLDCRPIYARRAVEAAGFDILTSAVHHMWLPVEIVLGRVNTRETFEANVISCGGSLHAAAMFLTRNPCDAEDLVQDTYVKAFRSADRFQPGTNLKAWLGTILRNTFLNDRRRSRRDPVDVDADRAHDVAPPADPHDDPEKRLLRAVVDADVLSALDALPDRFLQAVWLRDVEDLAYAEIAARLEIPLGTVMSRISRGRRLLHRHLTSEAPRTDA